MRKTRVDGQWVDAAPSLGALPDVDLTGAQPHDLLGLSEEGVWAPVQDGTVAPLAVEIVGYDSYQGAGPYTFDVPGIEADDIALLSRVTSTTAGGGAYPTELAGFTNLGTANFGGTFGIAYKICQNGETFEVTGSGGETSCALIVVRNADLASSSVHAERWSYTPPAPQVTAPAGSLDVVISARRMNTPPTGWTPRNVDVPGGLIATTTYEEETALASVTVSGGAFEYNGGGRALFTLAA